LPHLIEPLDQAGVGGDITIENAKEYLMYPVKANPPIMKITEFEREIAFEYVTKLYRHTFRDGRTPCRKLIY
jgi:hypothetical protein